MTQLAPAKNPAETYEQFFVPAMFRPWAAILLHYASPQSGQRVLDVACGTGIVAREVAPLVGQAGAVAAIDLNPAMIEVARSLPPPLGARIEWQHGDAAALPYPDASFDLVTCQQGLQFFPDRKHALTEMRRVLVPGGRAVLAVWRTLAQHPVLDAMMQALARRLDLPLAQVALPFQLCEANDLRDLFMAAHFQSVEIVPEVATVRFADAANFVALSLASSAAAIPTFAQMEAARRETLARDVQAEIAGVLEQHTEAGTVAFPMHAHIAIATS